MGGKGGRDEKDMIGRGEQNSTLLRRGPEEIGINKRKKFFSQEVQPWGKGRAGFV